MSQMISISQLAWKFYFFLRLFPTPSNIIAGFVCVTLTILVIFLTSSFLLPIGFLVSFWVISLDAFIYIGWEGIGVDNNADIEEPDCKDNCCNWFNKLFVLASIDLTNPLAWGLGFSLAISTLDLGAWRRIFWRAPDWEYISSNYWALKIACSSVNTLESNTSL